MTVYCTYCSANKIHYTDKICAIDLYQSDRIKFVFDLSLEHKKNFVILSGKYGLVNPKQEIDYYDHLLVENEIEEHSKKIAIQIREQNISEIVFYMNYLKNELQLLPYLKTIKKACATTGATLTIKERQFED